MPNVFAFAESRGGDVRRAGLEAVVAARGVADQTGGQVHAMIAGGPGIGAQAAKVAAHGADVVLVLEGAAFSNYNPEALAAAIAARIGSGYHAAFFSASVQGRDLTPRVAGTYAARGLRQWWRGVVWPIRPVGNCTR